MKNKIAFIHGNQTWELSNLPESERNNKAEMGFQNKLSPRWQSSQMQGMFSGKRVSQKQGVDFDDTFSHVAQIETVRTFFCISYLVEVTYIPTRYQIRISKCRTS